MHLRPILQLLANRQFEEDDHCSVVALILNMNYSLKLGLIT